MYPDVLNKSEMIRHAISMSYPSSTCSLLQFHAHVIIIRSKRAVELCYGLLSSVCKHNNFHGVIFLPVLYAGKGTK